MFRIITSSVRQRSQIQRYGVGSATFPTNRTLAMLKIPAPRLYCDSALTKNTALVGVSSSATACLRSLKSACRDKAMRYQRLSTSENPFMRRTSNVNEDDIPPITLNNTIRMKNAALATVLMGCCLGIMWYSMHAVGQAGEKDDPLSALKMEAAEAQKKHDQEQATTANAADMLEKFQKGEYDPDHVPEDEEDEPAPSKKPWWKVL